MEKPATKAALLGDRSRSLMRVWVLPLIVAGIAAFVSLTLMHDQSIWVVFWVGLAAASAASATALFVGGYVLQALADAEKVDWGAP